MICFIRFDGIVKLIFMDLLDGEKIVVFMLIILLLLLNKGLLELLWLIVVFVWMKLLNGFELMLWLSVDMIFDVIEFLRLKGLLMVIMFCFILSVFELLNCRIGRLLVLVIWIIVRLVVVFVFRMVFLNL